MINQQEQRKKNNLALLKKSILPILKKNGVVKAGIFGSFARGEEKKTSDLDILIELKRGKSLLDHAKLEQELEKNTKRKVQTITYKSIHPLLKERILKEEIRIYEKR